MEPAVELIDAHKSFGSVEALKGINIAVQRGELVAMLGPNGAGKTTAISLMLGMRRPTSGRARLFGLDPAERRARGAPKEGQGSGRLRSRGRTVRRDRYRYLERRRSLAGPHR